MPGNLRAVLAGAALAATAAGIGYTLFAVARMRAFRQRGADVERGGTPPVSILKPLNGDEPDLYEHLRTFCDQRYPAYQLIFCSADAGDPALVHAARLRDEFPHLDIQIAAGAAHAVPNPKIGNLLGGIDRAKHPIVLIADSDIRVDPAYLRTVAACFDDPAVGAATCVYSGVPGEGLPSLLGAMYVNEQFAPSVLVAAAMEPLTYCFGATMAVRASVLQQIGGLEALADRLGDDYRLGQLVAQAGYRVALCSRPVQTAVNEGSWGALIAHELRWARTIRSQRPAGYAGSVLTLPLVFAAAFAALCGSARWGWAVLAVSGGARALLALEAEKTFASPSQARVWLAPVRDGLSLGVWCAALTGRRVVWRAQELAVNAEGRLLDRPGECENSVYP